MDRRLNATTIALAAAAAGLGVGLLDGLRAALLARLSGADLFGAVGLVAGVDGLVGLGLGTVVAALVGAGRWGRAAGSRWATGLAWVVAAGAQAWIIASAFLMTGGRKNRLLAAVVVGLVGSLAAIALAALAPALGRLATKLHPRSQRSWPRGAATHVAPLGLLLLAPMALLACHLAVAAFVQQALVPVRRTSINLQLGALVAAPMPWLLAWLSARSHRRVGWGVGALGAALLLGVPGLLFVRARWISDFRFVPWGALAVVTAIALLGLAVAPALARRPLGPRAAWAALGAAGALFFTVALAAAEAEPARKAAASSGFAGVALGRARVALDWDQDGYARLLGGGDCDDGDAARNPMARDWPDDGVDQDCDGADTRLESVVSPRFHPVPDAVPRDLNVLLVTIDTLRADHLGAYGYKRNTSPALDRLARAGSFFSNGWAHAPSTRYSMPAIALSRWPSTIDWNMSIWWPGLGTTAPTLGEVFKSMGYVTGAFYAYQYFSRQDARGFERGIDFYEDHLAGKHMNVGGDPAHSLGSSGAEMADAAIRFFNAQRTNRWFLWLHFYDPHLEYQKHVGIDFGSSQVDLYDAEVRFTDDQVGRVLRELEGLGLWEKTAVFITGDHGEMLGEHADEHGSFGHGYRLFSQVTKVPFIARIPGLSSRRIDAPVGHVDIAPTLVNAARGPHQPTFLGRSALDLMSAAPAAPPPAPVFQDFGYEGPTEWRGLVSERHHLIWNVVPHNTRSCYDHVADPQERTDLWGTAAGGPCEPLRGALERKVKLLQLGKIGEFVTSPGVSAPMPEHARTAEREVKIGGLLRYVGHDLEPAELRRGRAVTVTHHFDVLERLNGWNLFFHLAGPGGSHTLLDHVPVGGAYPVERWQPGQRVRDRHTVTVPAHLPDGTYTIYVGLWRGAERLPITPPTDGDGQNRLPAVTFTVP